MSNPNLSQLAKSIEDSTAAQGVDAYAVSVCGLSATEWANMTGRSPSAVARNVRRSNN